VRPVDGGQVYLNEPLVLTFSHALDLASVTPESVELTSPRGRARGRWIVDGPVLRFDPDPVWDPGLASGGYEPGAEHRLILAGFPRLGGLRGADGASFEWTRTLTFHAADPADGPALYDLGRNPATCEPVRLEGRDGAFALAGRTVSVGVGEPLRLVCAEPLDPSTLNAEDFLLQAVPEPGAESPALVETEVSARVVRNDPATGIPDERCAVIELVPLRELTTGRYTLRVRPGATLADMGGNRAFLTLQPKPLGEVRVRHLPTESADRVRLEFNDRTSASAERVVGVDGTAAWRGDGTIRIAYPREAGPGGGSLVLDRSTDAFEIVGTRIDVPEGETCELTDAPGVVVLRAQGTLSITGALVRRRPTNDEVLSPSSPQRPGLLGLVAWAVREFLLPRIHESLAWAIREFVTDGVETVEEVAARLRVKLTPQNRKRLEDEALPRHEIFAARLARLAPTLGEFIEAARKSGTQWTVLIAGGDIVVNGKLDLAGQIVFVAGGRIRLDGRWGQSPEKLFTVGDGGGLLPSSNVKLKPLAVKVLPPETNPLDDTLTWAVVSRPLPRQVLERYLWRDLRPGGHMGNGIWRVRWLPADGPVDPALAADHPSRLPEGPVRMLVELTMKPGGVWDPPYVDFVELSWRTR
tara:strand:+ start:8922 stop:10841 length:1920 start_codon:yes stop_codon:yes gene_type:complete